MQNQRRQTIADTVAVIGGGIAGLSCACELSDAGMQVTVFEAKSALGGRAGSFRDRETGKLIDNCQHVLAGCCNCAIRFLSRIGSLEQVRFFKTLNFVGPEGKTLRIQSSFLPAPTHLLPSLARTRYLSTRDKLCLATMLARMAVKKPAAKVTAVEYLRRLCASQAAIDRVIEPILVSALNEQMDVASATYARMVLLKTLVGGKRSYRLGVPKKPLADLVAGPASRYLRDRGCQIRTSAGVERIETDGEKATSLVTQSGERIEFDHYVCAVPPWSLAEMGVDSQGGQDLIWRSVVCAHMFFEGPRLAFDQVCVVGKPFQWVFNKTNDFGRDATHIQAVASAAEAILKLSNRELYELAMRSAVKAEPALKHMKPNRAIICRNSRATFSTGGACDALRPSGTTPLRNLFLAGDWTDTRWPATIESAVRSGEAAAGMVIDSTRRVVDW